MRWPKGIWHSQKSGPETRDSGTWDPGRRTRDPGTRDPETQDSGIWDLGPWDLGLITLGHGTLTPPTLEMGPWDHETRNWLPPQIVLTLFVK